MKATVIVEWQDNIRSNGVNAYHKPQMDLDLWLEANCPHSPELKQWRHIRLNGKTFK